MGVGGGGIFSLQREVFGLYTAAKYQEALDLLNLVRGEYQAHAADLYYWEACLAGRLGQKETALRALAKAADGGYFYG